MKIGLIKPEYKYQHTQLVFTETIDSNLYDDVTTIGGWAIEGSRHFDYYYIRERIRDIVKATTFNTLSDYDKKIVADYCAADSSDLVPYYMAQDGLSLENATLKYKAKRALDINNAASACNARAESGIVFYIMIKYLSEQDSLQFKNAIHSYLQDYKEAAHLGTQYGISADGIMDYVEATGSHIGAGLSIYTFNTGYTYEQCKDELRNYLIFGIVPAEYELYT